MIVKQSDKQHLLMVRDAIVNVATKGITGFDSPMLANSLEEAIYNYETLEHVLTIIYGSVYTDKTLLMRWKEEFDACKKTLQSADFDSFDRYYFIKNHINTQLSLLKATAEDWQLNLNNSYALNPNATNLFGKTDFFNLKAFAAPDMPKLTEERIDLGRMLFNDNRLSTSGMSCATCHLKSKAFTDGEKTAIGNDGMPLSRNTPTLLYAKTQRSFFWDGTSSSLEGQILGVLDNSKEFHMDYEKFAQPWQVIPFTKGF